MANMIEHSNFVSVHHLKQEWEDELCDCKDTQFYWSY
jgi:hypothetical protein